MIVTGSTPPQPPALDPVQVQALLDKLSKLQSTAGSVLSNATQAKKLLTQLTAPPK